MDDMDHCGNCGGEVTSDSDFCPHCGVFFEHAPIIACETDPTNEADGVCVICRKAVCEQCCSLSGKCLLCPEHKGLEVFSDCVNVYQSDSVSEAEMVKSFLVTHDLEAIIRDGFFRHYSQGPAKVFVPIPQYTNAVEILRSSDTPNDGGGNAWLRV
ncbi:MAG: hypothetical protein HY088_02485 [Ignavibacteriales bacterium]|nr:hypothetical protein [Ignavibacteriales bacterium]